MVSGGRARPRKSTRGAQDRVRAAQLGIFPLQLADPGRIPAGGPRPLPRIDLSLLDPAAERIALLIPSSSPIRRHAIVTLPASPAMSRTKRIARSRISSGYFLGAGMTPPFRGFGVSINPGAIQRSDGKLPPHVMVYLVMALFADDDYEEVAARLTETLASWGCWDDSWSVPGSGGITQARQRLGHEPMKALFSQVAAPVAEELTAGAFLGPWRLMAIDGSGWDAPDTAENAAAFGFAGAGADDADRPAYPKVRVVTVSECASHAVADAAMGAAAGKGAGEQSLARKLYPRLDEDWLLIADRNFFNWADWCTAADSGAALLWRVKADLTLPVLELLPDGSYSSVLLNPKIRGKARQQVIDAARAGEDLDEDQARYVRVAGYQVPGRDGDGKGEVIALVTTITQMTAAPAPLLAEACHQRWGTRDRERPAQDAPARSRAGAAVQEPRHGPPGDSTGIY